MFHKTQSSAYIAHLTGDEHFLIRLFMNTKKSVGDMTIPFGTPCLWSIFLLFVLSTNTLTRQLCMYNLNHGNILPAMWHFFCPFL